MISIHSISHQYKEQQSLGFKDWKINKGDQWLLLGESGSGKTTLLHVIAGILKPHSGNVMINNTSLYTMSVKERDLFRGKNMGIVFQRPHLVKSLTITENLLIAQSFAKLSRNEKRIQEVLASLNIAEKKDSYPSQLSDGQLQRVSIARAVLNKPALMVADEPTSSLDDKNAFAVMELLMSQSVQNGSALVVATHDKRVKDLLSKQYLV
ncbi:ATP-binding cassette domain-containing protein [Pedobacter sp. P351]|uniref:ABC transporter ATP-binding protein n=1 Tax=Pedobacter superstes TaxID=3133441 RepID=UPI0030AA6CBE